MTNNKRVFVHSKAARVATPAMIGLVGPSGAGKTRSALRVATGLQRVTGGDIWMIDTEAKRGLHHADKFDFTHMPFGAPFGPLDYLAAFEEAIKNGARHIIVDSMSHEHEGPGGVLEMHAAEVNKRAEAEARKYRKRREDVDDERHNFPAWSEVKPQRRQMINFILQQECNFIFCFRAKPKTKMVKTKERANNGNEYTKTSLVEQGFQAIAGEEFLYEMLINFLLLPGAQGLPTFASEYPGERELIKVPEQFACFKEKPEQLSENSGEFIGRWCAGTASAVSGKPSANTQQQPKAPAKAQPKPPTQPAAKPESGAPVNGLRFHPKFGEHGGQLVEGADAGIRAEYEGWIDEYVSKLRGDDRVKGDKHLEEFRELHLQLTAEERMAAEESAA